MPCHAMSLRPKRPISVSSMLSSWSEQSTTKKPRHFREKRSVLNHPWSFFRHFSPETGGKPPWFSRRWTEPWFLTIHFQEVILVAFYWIQPPPHVTLESARGSPGKTASILSSSMRDLGGSGVHRGRMLALKSIEVWRKKTNIIRVTKTPPVSCKKRTLH